MEHGKTRCVDMTYISGEITFKDFLSMEIGKKVIAVCIEAETNITENGLTLSVCGEEFGKLEFALLHLKGVVEGDIEASSEDSDDEWYYVFKQHKWQVGDYKKVRAKPSVMKSTMTELSDKEKNEVLEALGEPFDKIC